MQTIKHYTDGRIEVIDTHAGIQCVISATAIDRLVAALEYGKSMPSLDIPAEPKRRLARKPRPALEVKEVAKPAAPAGALPALQAAIVDALKYKNCTAADLCEMEAVVNLITSPSEKVQRSTVLSALTRLVKASVIINVGDHYKVA